MMYSAPSSISTLKPDVVSPTRRVLNLAEVFCQLVRNLRPAASAAASVMAADVSGGRL
jgi:hypothetical protein